MIAKVKSILLKGYSKDKSLVRDSIILLTATMILNLMGFVFHFYMGRALGPSSYGVLGALLSLLFLLVVPTVTIQTTLTKFVSELNAEKQYPKVKYLLVNAMKAFFLVSVIGLVIYLLLSRAIASFLHISVTPVIILGGFLVFALLLPVSRGVMQGMQWFKNLGINMTFEGISKVVIGIVLVIIGLGVNGAALAIFLAFMFSFFITYFPLKKILIHKAEKYSLKPVYAYLLPVTLTLLLLTSFYSIDILLVKHFFDSASAGHYAAVSLIGKTVFFATIAITQVMFPKVSEMYKQKKPYKKFLTKSLLLISLIGVPMCIVYFLIPEIAVKIFFGSDYLDAANILWKFAVFMLLFSFTYAISMYNLSINRLKFLFILGFFSLSEAVLIWFYHASLLQIVNLLIGIGFAMSLTMFITTILRKNEY
ncbi:oligosaccharide flippase family protein [Candidatus Woesearchaeota archaeon]|nr:oligosaccharide flippase family protein [Candidatus Woesearchaeota archaeon]